MAGWGLGEGWGEQRDCCDQDDSQREAVAKHSVGKGEFGGGQLFNALKAIYMFEVYIMNDNLMNDILVGIDLQNEITLIASLIIMLTNENETDLQCFIHNVTKI